MVLNRNPANYFSDIEQSAFSPANLVQGIEPSPDKMLQGRLFSYHDTHIHRLGLNYHQLPVNCPYACKPRHYQRDGPQAFVNHGNVIYGFLIVTFLSGFVVIVDVVFGGGSVVVVALLLVKLIT